MRQRSLLRTPAVEQVLWIIVSVLLIPEVCALAQSPISQGPPTTVQNDSGYSDSPEGLQLYLTHLRSSSQLHAVGKDLATAGQEKRVVVPDSKIESVENSVLLPDHASWFVHAFGEQTGASLSVAYNNRPNHSFGLTLLADFAMNGATFQAMRLEDAANTGSDPLAKTVINAMKGSLSAYVVREKPLPPLSEFQMPFYFFYVDGKFYPIQRGTFAAALGAAPNQVSQNSQPAPPPSVDEAWLKDRESVLAGLDPGFASDIRRLLKATNMQDLTGQLFSSLLSSLRAQLLAKFPPSENREKIVDDFLKRYQEHLTDDQAINLLFVPLYAKYVTREQVKTLDDFFESADGKAFVQGQHSMLTEAQPLMVQYIQKVIVPQVINETIKDFSSVNSAANPASPPPADILGSLTLPSGGEDVGPFRPGTGGVGYPSCVYCPTPQYSAEARAAKVEGVVVLMAVIQPDGHATSIEIVKGLGLGLDEKAIEALGNWRFKAAVGPNGKPVPVRTPIEIKFNMEPQTDTPSSSTGTGQSLGNPIPGGTGGQVLALGGSVGTVSGQVQMLTPTEGVDFSPYLAKMFASVKRNWQALMPKSAQLGDQGRVILQFRIMQNGSVPDSEPQLVSASNKEPLDHAAILSIRASRPFEPLPPAFSGPYIELRVMFFYNLATSVPNPAQE